MWVSGSVAAALRAGGGPQVDAAVPRVLVDGRELVLGEGQVAQRGHVVADLLTDDAIGHIRALNELAGGRGQTLAQMALAWALRNPEVSSVLVGASSAEQIRNNVAALANPSFSDDELASIDQHARDSGIDLWASARAEGGRD